MTPQTIRRSALATAAAALLVATQTPVARAQEGIDRIVVTAPRTTMQRPTLQVIEGVREHVSDCLDRQVDLPRDAPEVRLRVRFRSDGTIDGPPAALPEPTGLEEDDRYVRAVAAARQALYACEPFDFLPAGEYQHWGELTIVFRSAADNDRRRR